MFKNRNQVFSSARSMGFILIGMEDGDFDLDPSYQRGYVWEEDNAQVLLFSLFNGFPIGSISLIEKPIGSSGPYIEVVDGKQRITTIFNFYKNEFPYIDEDGNKIYFKDMDIVDQRHFKTQLTLTVNTLAADISEIDKLRYFYAINFSGITVNDEHKNFVLNRILELKALES